MAINHRRNFIIDPKFQFKFSFIMCSLVFLGSLIYPFTIYDLFEYMISIDPAAAAQFAEERSDLLVYLGVTQFSFTGLVFIFCIFVSHKIAGPMYKLKMVMRMIRETGEVHILKFRKLDYFQDITDELNQTIDFLANKSEEEYKYLADISTGLDELAQSIPEDKKQVLSEIQTKIKAMQQYHQEDQIPQEEK